jgi:hypothetical protein
LKMLITHRPETSECPLFDHVKPNKVIKHMFVLWLVYGYILRLEGTVRI